MKKVKLNVEFEVYDSLLELQEEEQTTMRHAILMLDKAYAPYSNFHVGSAAMNNNFEIYGGCNQENAAYPLCICGERVALYNAGAHDHKTPIKTLAIVCHNDKKPVEEPGSPCGACRQVIAEFEHRFNQEIVILLKGDSDKIYRFKSIKDLLPLGFEPNVL